MHAPEFLGPFALIFLAALGAAFLLHRLRQPPLIGYLAAGILLGPFGLGLVRDVGAVEALAELGVVLLLFTVGLELSLGSLRRLGKIATVAGPIQLCGTIALVVGVATAAGYPAGRSLFFGYLVALSSTAIVLKLLSDRRELDSPHGRFLVGILIVQDLAVVPMLLSINILSQKTSGDLLPVLGALGKMVITAAILVVAARVAIPRFIGALAGTRQKEIFVIAVLFLVLASALATSWAGLSAALGAFLAGLILAESDYGHQAMADIAPLRDAFNAVFFVSIGMLFDPRILTQEPLLVAMLLALILVGKAVVGALPVILLGHGLRVAVVVGISLAQIGEFSFVLLRQGREAGLIGSASFQAFLGAAILSMLATPFLSEKSHAIALRLAASEGRAPSRAAAAQELATSGHVVVVGFGHMGETVARVLQRAEVPFRVIDLDPDRVRRGRKRGIPIEYGDSTNDTVLRRAHVQDARAVIVLLSDPRATRQTIRHCRGLASGLFVLARARYLAEIPALSAAGADEVVAEEFESSLEIAGRTLRRLGLSLPWIESETDEIRRTRHDGFRRFRAPGTGSEAMERALGGARAELIAISSEWTAAGRCLGDLELRKAGGAIVLAVVRDGKPIVTPGADLRLSEGDQSLILGTEASVEGAIEALRGNAAPAEG
jgi:CPA2 family monovalent cation:H+ antiporter-2